MRHSKKIVPALILASILLAVVGMSSFPSDYMSNVLFSYTGFAAHLGGTTNTLIGHYGQVGQTLGESMVITIINKGSAAQVVTLKLWSKDGVLVTSANNTVQPNAQWQLFSSGGFGTGPAGDWNGYFTIEANDVFSLYPQAYVLVLNAGNSLVFPVTISPLYTSGSTPPPPPALTDTTPPNTILASTPPTKTTSTSATFTFNSTESGSTFECKLDAGSFESCASPKTYSGLSKGKHTFSVRAKDAAGNLDPTPASFSWSITR